MSAPVDRNSWTYRLGQVVAVFILLCFIVLMTTAVALFLDYALGELSR